MRIFCVPLGQQAIIWAIVDQYISLQMASLGGNE